MVRHNVILAVFLRNLTSYFSGVLGYLFIVFFVVIGAVMAFSQEFFADNVSTLDHLTESYPMLLLFIVPAITMSVWAEEKRQGTDELLFTLPASDLEVLLGKFKAVTAVYTITLLFSLTHAFMLSIVGNPDGGALFATYFGYWLAGTSLLAAGMYASSLTNNSTVAFVGGVVTAGIPVFFDTIIRLVCDGCINFIRALNTLLNSIPLIKRLEPAIPEFRGFFEPLAKVGEQLSVGAQLSDFNLGLIPLAGVIYFVSVAVVFLYMNHVSITKRHWAGGEHATAMSSHFRVRALSVAVALMCVVIFFTNSTRRLDLTQNQVYTLSRTTKDVISSLDKEESVTIQAFVSPDVPQDLVTVRKRLLGLLSQYDSLGGKQIEVRPQSVEVFSEAAEEASLFGIEPRMMREEVAGEIVEKDVFMGFVVTGNYDEVVVPFLDKGSSVEYELTRSVRTVSQKKRQTVGILENDLQITGGRDMQTFRERPEWRFVRELKKQFRVVNVSPDSAIKADSIDVLVAVMPSMLTTPQMQNLVAYVDGGHPILIFDDPAPYFVPGGLQMAPRMPKPQQGGMFGQGPQPEPKASNGKATELLSALKIAWNIDEIVFDRDNPHRKFADIWPEEFVFVSRKKQVKNAFSEESPITDGLQELFVIYSGTIQEVEDDDLEYTPLLRTGAVNSGLLDWEEDRVFVSNFLTGPQPNPLVVRESDKYAHVLAARIKPKGDKEDGGVNAVFVADVDMISDPMFGFVESEGGGFKLDNIVFVLNAIDDLTGNRDLIELRKRRAESRTLTLVEEQITDFVKEQERVEQEAREQVEKELERREQDLEEEIDKIAEDDSLAPREKAQQLNIARERQTQILQVAEQEIKRKSEEEIRQKKLKSEREIDLTKSRIQFWATIVPPLPAIALGLIFWLIRYYNERKNISHDRLVKR